MDQKITKQNGQSFIHKLKKFLSWHMAHPGFSQLNSHKHDEVDGGSHQLLYPPKKGAISEMVNNREGDKSVN